MDRRKMMMGGTTLLAGVAAFSGTARADDNKAVDTCCGDCADCRTTCLTCVAACLDEGGRKECINLCLDCADICGACDAIAARKGPMASAMMAICAEACDKCAAECEKHKDDPACLACAEACRACAQKCRDAKKAE